MAAECPECGSENLNRNIGESNSSNRTKNRLVGGQNRHVNTECRDCGWSK